MRAATRFARAGGLHLDKDMQNELHHNARALAAKGLAVFPCLARGKAPAVQRGVNEATTDAATIDTWWRLLPDGNIGIACGAASGVFVLDVDGEDGEASLRQLEAEHGRLPATIEVITGNGRHCYFRLGEHDPVPNSAGRIGKGLDTRGVGGYVLAPPSIHPTGRRYAWSVDSANEFAEPPDWLIVAALPPPPPRPRPRPGRAPRACERYVAAAISAELNAVASASDGCRNDTLNRAAFAIGGFVRAGVVPDDWAAAQLEDRAADAGLPAIEARRTIASAFAAAEPRELPDGR